MGDLTPVNEYDPVTKWLLTRANIYIHTYIYVCMCLQVHVHVYVHVYVYVYTYLGHINGFCPYITVFSVLTRGTLAAPTPRRRASEVRRADLRLVQLRRHEIQKLRRPNGSATGQVLLERSQKNGWDL